VVTTGQSFNKLDPIDYYVQYDTDDIVESHGIISFDEEKWQKRFLSVGEAWDTVLFSSEQGNL